MKKIISVFIIFNYVLSACAFEVANWHEGISSDPLYLAQAQEVIETKQVKTYGETNAESEKNVGLFDNKKEDKEHTDGQKKREAKTFALFKRKQKDKKSKSVQLTQQESGQEAGQEIKQEATQEVKQKVEQKAEQKDPAVANNAASSEEIAKNTPAEIKPSEDKRAENKEVKRKKTKKEKLEEKYKEYEIPIDGYMPVGNSSDKSITITGSIQKTLELNLADCLELALINNPKIKSAYADAEAFKYKKGQTLSNYSPVVNLSGSISRVKPDMSSFKSRGFVIDPFTKYTMGSIGISQLVYDFGITQNQYTIDKLNWESSKSNIDSVVNEVVCQIKDAYYNLIYAIEAKRVAQETLEQFEIMYNQALAFYEVGTRPKVDVTIAQVNMEDARAKFINAGNNVDIAISNLNNLMGLPFIPPYVIDTSAPFQEVNIDMRHAVEIANEFRPELKIAKIKIETADQAVKLAKKIYLPSLEFAANWSIGGVGSTPADTKWWDIGGYLTFPSINPFLLRNQLKEARALLNKQKFDSKAIVNDVYYDIQSTYVKLADAKQRVPVAELAVKKAKENHELSQGRYKVGVSDAIEYKEAQIQYYDARLAYLNTLYQYNSAKANLERAIGQTLPGVDSKDDNAQEGI